MGGGSRERQSDLDRDPEIAALRDAGGRRGTLCPAGRPRPTWFFLHRRRLGSGRRLHQAPASAGIVFAGDEGRLSEAAFLHDFAGDLPEAKAKILYAIQESFQKALRAGKTTQAAWRSKPSFYAVSTGDRTINPDLERFMAKRMGAKTIEVKVSHLSLISHPEEITRLILDAAGQQA
jgi:hypothetical protein